jgi:ParB family transcriptional regulator, chromosome partitioning protein
MLYGAIKSLSDHDLDGLLTLLTALSFGQVNCERLDSGESIFNAVATDLGVSMRNHWQPDAAFLSRRTQAQLLVIARECGYAEGRGNLAGYKKSELVTGLVKHFENARLAADPNPVQLKAREWVPDAMRFPAIDPDAAGAGEAEDDSEDDTDAE